jgi:hypothetical protein
MRGRDRCLQRSAKAVTDIESRTVVGEWAGVEALPAFRPQQHPTASAGGSGRETSG